MWLSAISIFARVNGAHSRNLHEYSQKHARHKQRLLRIFACEYSWLSAIYACEYSLANKQRILLRIFARVNSPFQIHFKFPQVTSPVNSWDVPLQTVEWLENWRLIIWGVNWVESSHGWTGATSIFAKVNSLVFSNSHKLKAVLQSFSSKVN